jgi:TadE-like protein
MPDRRTTPTRRPPRPNAFPRLVREERGVALTEFAVVLPWLLLLLLGLIDFGKAINYWIDETHLASSGARWAVVNYNPGNPAATGIGSPTLQTYIRQHADSAELRGDVQGTQQNAHHADVTICFYHNGSSTTAPVVGDTVKVTVKYRYDWLHFLLSKAGIGPSTEIGSSASERLEALPTHYTYDAGCPSSI